MNVGILIFDDAEELDFVGPWEVLTMARKLTDGAISVVTIAEKSGPVRAAKGLRVLPEHTFDDAPELDVLVVPGGQGTRLEVKNTRLIAWLKNAAMTCTWITSVCTGAFLLHEAGFLNGKRATTHWASADRLAELGDVTVVRDARYVRDGNVVTAAGVSAGIDMALWLVGQIFDESMAKQVQRAMEYDPEPPYGDPG